MANTTEQGSRVKRKGVRYELYLTEEMDEELKALRERTGNSAASFIRNAIRAAIEVEAK